MATTSQQQLIPADPAALSALPLRAQSDEDGTMICANCGFPWPAPEDFK